MNAQENSTIATAIYAYEKGEYDTAKQLCTTLLGRQEATTPFYEAYVLLTVCCDEAGSEISNSLFDSALLEKSLRHILPLSSTLPRAVVEKSVHLLLASASSGYSLLSEQKNFFLFLNSRLHAATFYQSEGNEEQSLIFLREAMDYYVEVFSTFSREEYFHASVRNFLLEALRIYQSLQHYEETMLCLEIMADYFSKTGEKDGLAMVYGNMGNTYLVTAEYSLSLKYFALAGDIFQETGDKSRFALVLTNIGVVYRRLGNYTASLEHYSRALEIFENVSDTLGVARTLDNISIVCLQLNKKDAALEYALRANALFEELDDIYEKAQNLLNIASVYSEIPNLEESLVYYEQAYHYFSEIQDKLSLAITHQHAGNTYRLLKKYDLALTHYQKSLALNTELGSKDGIAIAESALGVLYNIRESHFFDAQKAEDFLLNALRLNKELRALDNVITNLRSLSELCEGQHRWQEALQYFKEYDDLKNTVHNEKSTNLANYFLHERSIAEMRKEREVTDMLLHKFLPSPIVNEVKAKEGKILVEKYESVSVLFADLVGFTKLSLQIPPEVMIEMLNFIFTKFDSIVKEAGGHRIRTMGDGYFAVCGAPDRVEQHQYKLAKAALRFMEDIFLPEHIKKHLPEGTVLDIRIGLHCGEAVCGMVGGLEKWQYDIYGDTVNTASRMESHGEAGKIHISEDFKDALADYPEFTFVARSPLSIKGKGTMNTFFLQ